MLLQKSELLKIGLSPANTSNINTKMEEDGKIPIPQIDGNGSYFFVTPPLSTAPNMRTISKVDVK